MPDESGENQPGPGPGDAAEELTEAQVAILQQSLHDLREQLRAHLDASRESAAPVQLDQSSVGRLSRMDAMQAQQVAAAGRRQAQVRLDQIRAALRLMENGDYGLCGRCEEPIGYRRLQARPESPLCVGCQGRRERR